MLPSSPALARNLVAPLLARWGGVVLVALALAGCGLEPLEKDHCRSSSDCDNGRVCVSSRCREPFRGVVADAAVVAIHPDAEAPKQAEPARFTAEAGAPPDAAADVPGPAELVPEVRDAAEDPLRLVDARLKRDAPPRDTAPDRAPDLASPDTSPELAIDAAPDVPIDAPEPEIPDAMVVLPDAAPDLAAPDRAPLDVTPDLVDARSPDTAPDVAPAVCGDGVRQAGEDCDDGNAIDEDGCTVACTLPSCGDGISQAGEECDDGNASDDDRCTTGCKLVPFKQIVGDTLGGCGLRTNGTVTCWDESVGAPVPPLDRFSSIARGHCGVRLDGTIACWGAVRTIPTGTFSQVAVGNGFVCGLHTTGDLACAGVAGAAGLMPPTGTFTRVGAQGDAACAIRTDGTIACWGTNANVTTGVPTGTFVEIAVGGAACATDAAGNVKCWGIPSPTDPGGPGALHAIVMDTCYGCGIRTDASPICWRDMTKDCPPGVFSGPGDAPWHPGRYVQVNPWSCGLLESGFLSCGFDWSINDLLTPTAPPVRAASMAPYPGRFGDGLRCVLDLDGVPRCTTGESTDPKGPFEQLAMQASSYACGIDAAKHLTCWPHAIPTPTGTFRQVVAAVYHTCALRTDGTVTCWAVDDIKDIPNNSVITTAPGGTWKALSPGRYQTCGLRPSGSVECWGEMEVTTPTGAQLFSSLKPPPTGTFVEVAAGYTDSCALTADGKTVCWGIGPVSTGTPPVGLHGLSVGERVACGLTATNDLSCWGDLSGWTFIPAGPFRTVQVQRTAVALRRNGRVIRFGPGGGWTNGDNLP